MTAQIRPNRMEVSDRFPMLGFAVRTEEPNLEAEVVLATDIALFQPQNRASRTAANFYSSREHGMLSVPRGDGIFVVPPEVLARFIGNDRLFFGLATGRSGNGGLKVDALPREGSPYVSLRGFTGRTLRRSFGAGRAAAPPMLEWTGDAARPGTEPSNGNGAKPANGNGTKVANGNGQSNGGPSNGNGHSAANGNGGGAAAGAPAGNGATAFLYDDGFGVLEEVPALGQGPGRRRPSRGYGLQMSDGLTAQAALDWIRARAEQAAGLLGSDVSPPSLYQLGANSAAFRTAWEVANTAAGILSPLNGFLAQLPSLADSSGVTISIGPALDTPVFGGGIGAVFEPGGQVALFGGGEISIDPSGIQELVTSLKLALQAKLKLGYNAGGIAAFANIGKVAAVNVGEELVVGAEVWLDRAGNGIGGAVSIGVGFALQLAAQEADRRRRGQPVRAMGGRSPRRYGLQMSDGLTPEAAFAWIRSRIEQAVSALGSDVDPPYVYRLNGNSELFRTAWQTGLGVTSLVSPTNAFLAALPALADRLGVTFSIGPALDTPLFGGGVGVVFEPGGQVALFGAGELGAELGSLQEFVSSLKLALQAKLKFGYNAGGIAAFANIGKVAAVNVGEELVVGAEIWLDRQGVGIGGATSIGVGFALQLAAQEAERARAERIGGRFAPQVGRALELGLDPRKLEPLLDVLDPPPAAQPMAMRAPARGLGAGAWTVNWDDVELVPQPNGSSCWAAAASMVVGWRDWVSLSPETIGQICARAISHGLSPSDRQAFAADIGLETEPPMSYSAEGFRSLLETRGPLWVSKLPTADSTGGHAVVVTGMYFDGTNHFVRVADPWDRVVGTPGAPGAYAPTHATGSRYIMRYEDFQTEYEMRITGNPPHRQIMHAGGTFGHMLNTGQASPPPGYAMVAEPPADELRPPPPPRARAMDGGATGVAVAIGGILIESIRDSQGDVNWDLDQFRGIKHPNDAPPANPGPFRDGATIRLDDWPAAGGIADEISAWFRIDWQYNGRSLGNVRIVNIGVDDSIAWGLHVRAQIMDDNQLYPPGNCAALRLTFHYRFSRTIGSEVIAIREVKLYGDGTWEADGGTWAQASMLGVRRNGGRQLHA